MQPLANGTLVSHDFDWTANGSDLVLSRGNITSNVVMIDGFR